MHSIFKSKERIRTLGKIIRILVGTIVGFYVLLLLLFMIPSVNRSFADFVANQLGEKLGTNVYIGDVSIGMLNRIILSDVVVEDKAHKEMINAKRISAKIEYAPLLKGSISIRSIELMNFNALLYKKTPKDEPNYQFVLKAFESKDTTSSSSLDLSVNSLIVRRANIKYDVLSAPLTYGKLNAEHLSLSNVMANLRLKKLTSDSLNLRIRSFSAYEQSGLDVKNLSLKAIYGNNQCSIKDLSLELPQTKIAFSPISMSFSKEHGKAQIKELITSLKHSEITLSDFRSIAPTLRKLNNTLTLSASIKLNNNQLSLKNISIKSQDKNINILGNTLLTGINSKKGIQATADFSELMVTGTGIRYLYKALDSKNAEETPAILSRIGNVKFVGNVSYINKDLGLFGSIESGAASTKANLHLTKDGSFDAILEKTQISLGRILEQEKLLGNAELEGKISGKIADIKKMKASCSLNIKSIDFNKYNYKNINIDASLDNGRANGDITINDEHLNLRANIFSDIIGNGHSSVSCIEIKKIMPSAINLTKEYGKAYFSSHINIDISGTDINSAEGTISINDLTKTNEEKTYSLNALAINVKNIGDKRSIKMDGDFGNASIYGHIDFASLGQSLMNIASHSIPSIAAKTITTAKSKTNEFNFEFHITKTDFFDNILRIPVHIKEKASILGYINEKNNTIRLSADIPSTLYDDNDYSNIKLYVDAKENKLKTIAQITKQMQNSKLKLVFEADAHNDTVNTSLDWDTDGKQKYGGRLNTSSRLYKDKDNGNLNVNTKIDKSNIIIHDSVWQVSPSYIMLRKDMIQINHFKIGHKKQYLAIDGSISKEKGDSLMCELSDLNLEYIFDLLNFHAVDFAGRASGKINMNRSGGKLNATANINVKKLIFNGADMGRLDALGIWNDNNKQIDITASLSEPEIAFTSIKGNVSPERNSIDLRFDSQHTPVGFLDKFLGDILENISGRMSGKFRLFGTFSDLQLEGRELANVNTKIKALNTTYYIDNDSIILEPGLIKINNVRFSDHLGGTGTVSGNVTHDYIRNIRYDFNINATNLLGYNFGKETGDGFYGKVFASGDVHLFGGPGKTNVDMYVVPNDKTVFVYNASKPAEVSDTKFITFVDKTPKEKEFAFATNKERAESTKTEEEKEESGDLYLNLVINANPSATLRVIMDEKNGDYIDLNGTGNLKANYYNKGKFQMYGTYKTDKGVYKMSLQDVIHKDFKFLSGGSIVFGGDPFKSTLDLKAAYTVNSANLNDLNIGTSFANNSVKVDCLLGITGTPGSPIINFDFDLPTVSQDEKQMIRKLISTEEDINMQVIYLLSVGRFYTYDYSKTDYSTNQSQSTIAMRSLLSNTLSGQLNSILSNAIGSSNWTFGTSLATGNTGWNDMEVEGILSGRLLNNRLLINGNFGYRDKAEYNNGFIGDFNIQYLLNKSGNISLKAYSETNDRYFTKSSLTTQGGGLVFKRDFNSLKDFFRIRKKGSSPKKATP